jgi:hypothetical protein
MKTKSSEFTPIPARRTRRTVPGHFEPGHFEPGRVEPAQEHAMPEAFDEIFMHLALRQEKLERANRAIEADRIRDTASEMDRQRERLSQLLRDIDLSA